MGGCGCEEFVNRFEPPVDVRGYHETPRAGLRHPSSSLEEECRKAQRGRVPESSELRSCVKVEVIVLGCRP